MTEKAVGEKKRVEKGGQGGKERPSKGLIVLIAKTLYGAKGGAEWKSLDKDKKRPHLQMARKVLAKQARYKEKPPGKKVAVEETK